VTTLRLQYCAGVIELRPRQSTSVGAYLFHAVAEEGLNRARRTQSAASLTVGRSGGHRV